MSKQIVILGSAGLVGTAVTDFLSENPSWEVYAHSTEYDESCARYRDCERVQVIQNLKEVPPLEEALLLNFAFPRSSDGGALASALDFTEYLVKQAAELGVETFINVSSQSVYPQSGQEIQSEEGPVAPPTFYGLAKYATEKITAVTAKACGIAFTNIRLGSIFSPTFDQRMLNRFRDRIIAGESLTVDRGTPKVSFIHLQDAAAGLIRLLEQADEVELAPAYNLTSNEWMTVGDLIRLTNEVAEAHGFKPVPVDHTEKESTYNNVSDSSLFYQTFDWRPAYTLKNMVEELF